MDNQAELERLQAENKALRQQLAEAQARNVTLMKVVKEAKRLVSTQTRKAGVDYFRNLLRESKCDFE